MKGKPHKIDILKLYAKSNTEEWNRFLTWSLAKGDLSGLEKVLYGLQLGMLDLAKKKMNTDKITIFFLRLQRSLERTIRDVIRKRDPHPLDNPMNKEKFGHMIDSKKKRDMDIEKHLRKVRF